MKLTNYVRNDFGKCDLPRNTVEKIKDGFRKLNLRVDYAPYKVSDNIYWGQIWIDSIQIVCNGKGMTPELAEASAHAELAERFSAGLFYAVFEERVRFNIPALYDRETSGFLNHEWMDGYVHAHQDALEGDILPIESLLANERHLTEKDITSIKSSKMASHWVNGFSILGQKTVKVPINFVNYIHASNGLAAGNTLEEAMIQASCEIFERHVQIHIIKPEKTVPTIDPNSVDHAGIQKMIQYYQGKNVDVLIKDLSMGGVFPCIGVLFINHNLSPGRLEHKILIPGACFHLDEALTRCFTESMQGRETLAVPRPQLDKPVVHRSRVNNFYLLMKCCISPKDISFLEKGEMTTYRNLKSQDVFGEIEQIKSICRQLNTDCILMNYTHPVLNFPVVRVIIPGVSDFLPFLSPDILTSEETKPSAAWRGERFRNIMQSFFL
ncbi:MAG: YcaO-like family protein [Proteobacteria bacterium]|nr:YcaO-like family protein [Pseudomonadota bacterium]MBU4471904.1 YcaO-like family protein [Pseudomonadota bacterium]MCG2752820.1 YcaO-like family protein [Desulfobacteraceae bacterium]